AHDRLRISEVEIRTRSEHREENGRSDCHIVAVHVSSVRALHPAQDGLAVRGYGDATDQRSNRNPCAGVKHEMAVVHLEGLARVPLSPPVRWGRRRAWTQNDAAPCRDLAL